MQAIVILIYTLNSKCTECPSFFLLSVPFLKILYTIVVVRENFTAVVL